MKKIITLFSIFLISSLVKAQPGGGPIVNAGIDRTICQGDTVTLTANVFGGAQPYTFNWSSGETTKSINVSPQTAVSYTVVVTDKNGQKGSDTVKVTVTVLNLQTTSSDANCGQSDGSATVQASAGLMPYTYSWNTTPAQTTATATGLAAGIYTVVVSDFNGCSGTASVAVNNSGGPVVTTDTSHVTCNGGADGAATALVTGGTLPYTYSWNTTPAQATDIATGLIAGTYAVTVTDSAGCMVVEQVAVMEPAAINLQMSFKTANCGMNNGGAAVSAQGGTPGYQYLWAPDGETTDSIFQKSAGSYTVTVTDKNGCTVSATVTVPSAPAFTLKFDVTPVTCNGGSDGSASVTVIGGTSPFTYQWSNGEATDIITGLSAGAYMVTVTDSAGCTGSDTVTVQQPGKITVQISSTNSSCGGSTGSATATPMGGASPYTYTWSNGDSTRIISGLSSGSYTVIVTDKNGCTGTNIANVSDLGAPSVNNTNTIKKDVSCNGGSDGSATVNPMAGMQPYTYTWSTSPSDTLNSVDSLMAGSYTVTVTGNDGCQTIRIIVINEPAALNVSVNVQDASCAGCCDGIATSSVNGGVQPYTYQWSDDPDSLCAGTYTLCITDKNGCVACDTFSVAEPPTAVQKMLSSSVTFQVYPNPARDENTFISFTLTEESEVTVTVYGLSGRVLMVPVEQRLHPSGSHVLPLQLKEGKGVYLIRMTINGIHYHSRFIQLF